MIYDEFANITDEQKEVMTFNYTTLLFRPDRYQKYFHFIGTLLENFDEIFLGIHGKIAGHGQRAPQLHLPLTRSHL